ncbi:MAG: hypothetical protein ABIN36_15025 [Ferruginibacter sp.]
MNLLKKARQSGATMIEIKEIALKSNYEDDFETEINRLSSRSNVDDLPF